MSEVGLTYKGRQLYLDPGFQIDWEVEDDLLNPLDLGRGFSAPVEIPVKGNEVAFKYASDPSNTKNYYKMTDGWAITVGGNIWFACMLELVKTTPDGRYYSCIITTVPTAIFENKSKAISEVLDGVTWSYPSGGYNTVYAYFNGSTNRGIRFPWVHFYGEYTYNPVTGDKVDIYNKDIYAVPFFHLKHIVELVLAQIGYSIKYNVINRDFEKVLINTPRSFGIYADGGTQSYSKFMPSLSVADLLLELVFYTSGKITVDADDNTIYVESLAYSSSRKTAMNITDKVSDKVPPSQSPIDNVIAEYDYESDSLLSGSPLELEGNYVGEFSDKQTYEITGDEVENNYAYCKAENAFYKWINVEDTLRLEYYTHPFLERKTGTTNLLGYVSKLSPVSRTRYTFAEFDVDADLVEYDGNNSAFQGKVQIQGFENAEIVTDYDYVGILEFKTRERLSDSSKAIISAKTRGRTTNSNTPRVDQNVQQYQYGLPKQTTLGRSRRSIPQNTYYIGVKETVMDPTYVYAVANEITGTPDDTLIVLVKDYIADAEVSKLKMAKVHERFFLMIGKQLYRSSNADNSTGDNTQDTSGSVCLWHGLQFNFSKTETFPYAAPDNWYYNQTDGEVTLGTYSLNLQAGTNTIWDVLFAPIYQLIQDLRIVSLSGYLSSVGLKNLVKNKTARYQKGIFRFKSFRALLTRRGIRDQEIEGYGL